MSGKIMEKSTKKMLRLVPLARQKILDPLRKVLVVDGAYALATDTQEICIELLIEDLVAGGLSRVSNCGT